MSLAKRLFDLVFAVGTLLVLLPFTPFVVFAIKIDSKGAVFFGQIRVGQHGTPFRMLKLRTMVENAEAAGINISPTDDPRITRVGRFLRKYSFDELPQVINVLKGEMSVVGPRPETPGYVIHYTPAERRVLECRPGMAGPATLAFLDESERLAAYERPEEYYLQHLIHERLALDLAYALGPQTLGSDLRLLWRLFVAIFAPADRHAAGPTR